MFVMIPGRKTGWTDAQWLQKLHALGLLQTPVHPDVEIVALRTLVRYRAGATRPRNDGDDQRRHHIHARHQPCLLLQGDAFVDDHKEALCSVKQARQ